MWAQPTFHHPTKVSISHIKPVSLTQNYTRGHFTTGTGIQFVETKVLNLNHLKCTANICRAGTKAADCLDTSQLRQDDHPIVREALKRSDAFAYIRWMLSTFDDGRISISPYDTAWVALIENIDASHTPQFPSSLVWIARNQFSDGSWGDAYEFSTCERLLNTLACVIALRSWNIHPDKSERGITFLKDNLSKLEANLESLTCGFEIIFPPLLERARLLGIEIPYDAPVLREIFALRDLKLARIPKDLMHEVPTPLLYNLEGIAELNWEKLLKLQTKEGSFLTSPSATAFAIMQTKDKQCLKYLTNIITKFSGGAPTVYPIDLFARLWAVDRLQRLGISRLFEKETTECLNYIYRYWTRNGVFSGRQARIYDLDDTSMGFRLLRLQGQNVSPDVFNHFRCDDKFHCLCGELNKSPTTLLNLYRASQVQFPGEKILEEAKIFSYNFLKERVARNEFGDKWVISKDIQGELRYGLEIPWYASLPRIEARFYIEQCGGADEVWVGKTLYRVAEISNNVYLELAKLDYNECQAKHQLEWINLLRWWVRCNLQEYGVSGENLLLDYFLAAASIFEPGRSIERLVWTKSQIFIRILKFYFDQVATSSKQRSAFLAVFKGNTDDPLTKIDEMGKGIVWNIREFIYQLSIDIFEELDLDVRQQLNNAWETWLTTSIDVQFGNYPNVAAFLVHVINLCAGNTTVSSHEMLCRDDEYKQLSDVTNKVCHQIHQYKQNKKVNINGKPETNMGGIKSVEIETSMQELVQLVLQTKTSDIITKIVKQTFLDVAKAFYYTAYCDKETINIHISKVLFERVV